MSIHTEKQKKPHLLYPDFTVGTGISPVQPLIMVRGLYHRSRIAPCP